MEKIHFYLFHRNGRVRRIKQNSKITVSYFQHRRWQFLTLLEQLSGTWPHQSKLKQNPLLLWHSFIILLIFALLVNKFREYVGVDLINNVTIECCLIMLIFFCLFVKITFPYMHQRSRREAYKRIAKHFQSMSDPEEAAALNEAAERGFKYTLYYMYIISVVVIIYISAPVLRAFYDYFFIHRQLEVQMPVPLNYGFDHKKYWYIIGLHFLISMPSGLLVLFTHDFSFVLQVRHITALFKIVVIRLRRASQCADVFGNVTVSDKSDDESYSTISSAVDLHSECFKIVKLIEKSHTICWFIILLLSTGSLGACIHLIATNFHDPIDAFRYTVGFMINVLHFHMVYSHGQLIIDSANSVSDACWECEWYALPKKSRKLLTMMMIRTSIPCQLTGAKLFPLSIESFSKMLKAGLSYYTVFEAQR